MYYNIIIQCRLIRRQICTHCRTNLQLALYQVQHTDSETIHFGTRGHHMRSLYHRQALGRYKIVLPLHLRHIPRLDHEETQST